MDVTFIDDEHIEPTDSFIQSGVSLRESYVLRKKVVQYRDWVNTAIDPNSISKEDMDDLFSVWKKEAEIKYPDEGDYKVFAVVDNVPVPLGEVVEFIGGDFRGNPGQANTPCLEYLWDLSAEANGINCKIDFTNCRTKVDKIQGDSTDLKPNQTVCSLSIPVATIGVVTLVGPCTLPETDIYI